MNGPAMQSQAWSLLEWDLLCYAHPTWLSDAQQAVAPLLSDPAARLAAGRILARDMGLRPLTVDHAAAPGAELAILSPEALDGLIGALAEQALPPQERHLQPVPEVVTRVPRVAAPDPKARLAWAQLWAQQQLRLAALVWPVELVQRWLVRLPRDPAWSAHHRPPGLEPARVQDWLALTVASLRGRLDFNRGWPCLS